MGLVSQWVFYWESFWCNYLSIWLEMVEKGMKGGICHAIDQYAKANNKSMRGNNKEFSNLK